jgi:hypothetical protein
MKPGILGLIGLLTIGCSQADNKINEANKKFIGTFKLQGQEHYEILNVDYNYTLTSEYRSRFFPDGPLKEQGKWMTSGDTLIIERERHKTLKECDFPDKQNFLFRDDRLFELRTNYKGELFESPFYFERQ